MSIVPDHALYTVAQVRAMDRHAIDVDGIPGYELMQRAARAAWCVLEQTWPRARQLVLLCGGGNNGGDAFLLGTQALKCGRDVVAVALGAMDEGAGDAGRSRQAFVEAGGTLLAAEGLAALPAADVIVDGLFGTGLKRAPDGRAAALIRLANAHPAPVLALDVPSGLDADSGEAFDPAIRATATVSFVAHKRGLFTGQAGDCCGRIVLEDLDLPARPAVLGQPDARLLQVDALPPRPRASHKGDYGHVLALGGDLGMGGAIRLCSEAALRCGAGLVSVATRQAHLLALQAARPELMAHAVEDQADLEPLFARASVLALGPGLGRGEWGRAIWQAALGQDMPTVLDADALNLLAEHPVPLHAACVVTPHPGEAARLLQATTRQVQADRYAAVRNLARRYGVVAVLKGSGTLIADPDGQVAVCPWGNPGMASAGMGDVLCGVIAAMLAQGLPAREAACLGVGIHARAGDRAAARGGERGLLAGDLMCALREVVNGN